MPPEPEIHEQRPHRPVVSMEEERESSVSLDERRPVSSLSEDGEEEPKPREQLHHGSSRNAQEKIVVRERLGRKQRFLRLASSYWLFEFFFWVFGMLCLLAIVILLHEYDGELVPAWKYGITLNTIVSLLSSFAGFALMVPITAGLGQLKWLRFQQTRPLNEFDAIEQAGRGPVGSALLLLHGRGG